MRAPWKCIFYLLKFPAKLPAVEQIEYFNTKVSKVTLSFMIIGPLALQPNEPKIFNSTRTVIARKVTCLHGMVNDLRYIFDCRNNMNVLYISA